MKTIKYAIELEGVVIDKKTSDIRIGIAKSLVEKKINGDKLEVISIREIVRQEEKEKRDKQPEYLKIVIAIKKDPFENADLESKEEKISELEDIISTVTGGKIIGTKDISQEN